MEYKEWFKDSIHCDMKEWFKESKKIDLENLPLHYRIKGDSFTPHSELHEKTFRELTRDYKHYLDPCSSSPHNTYSLRNYLLNFPLTDIETITYFQDAVEEIIENSTLKDKINDSFKEYREINQQFGMMNIGRYNKYLISNYFPKLNEALSSAKSKILKDMAIVFGSKEKEGWPFFNFIKFINFNPLEVICNQREGGFIDGYIKISDSESVKEKERELSILNQNEMNLLYALKGGRLSEELAVRSEARFLSEYVYKDSLIILGHLYDIAELSQKENFKRPHINSEGLINIVDSVHPLLYFWERQQDNNRKIVPNDISFQKGKVVVITGPNACGKSVYIQQIGSLSLMAQAGYFLPMKEGTLPVFSKIFSQLEVKDNIKKGESTFENEIKFFEMIRDKTSPDTLAIFDELPRATEPTEGTRLYKAILRYFLEEDRGTVVIATHNHEAVKEFLEYPKIVFLNFGYGEDGKPDYKVREGITQGGYSLQSAKRIGISEDILKRVK